MINHNNIMVSQKNQTNPGLDIWFYKKQKNGPLTVLQAKLVCFAATSDTTG